MAATGIYDKAIRKTLKLRSIFGRRQYYRKPHSVTYLRRTRRQDQPNHRHLSTNSVTYSRRMNSTWSTYSSTSIYLTFFYPPVSREKNLEHSAHQKSFFLQKILLGTDIILYLFERSFNWPFLGIFPVWVNRNLELQIHAEGTRSKKTLQKLTL